MVLIVVAVAVVLLLVVVAGRWGCAAGGCIRSGEGRSPRRLGAPRLFQR